MREILGERRRKNGKGDGKSDDRAWAVRGAALTVARRWRWPVLPGAEMRADGRCGCPRTDCAVPGAHPLDPGLLAATTDVRMVSWWWTERPRAPIVMATGGRAPCALSLPAAVGPTALAELDRAGVRAGPVVAAPTRWLLLVEPYELPELGELLSVRNEVPSSLRFHGVGGYVPLPPSRTGAGTVDWAREPQTERRGGRRAVALPRAAELLDVLVEAGLSAPDQGSRLSY
ncbi:bifunctional DNA primase/polymerase [Streptomyces sp. NBC_01803]|uniref:bifunctional DNA primase/polymerase n=1 Tax=Streptomyces sp. NBC_01803 TaxID=2975946 RepID=UPI002DDAF0B4|nr:bifunctional DNA primase/polymerase [Streptomyces sp. NBC_01803]WSA45378.1 bifunctional DNA primase/polymerase [Streptomyces sp. NBC_01803]